MAYPLQIVGFVFALAMLFLTFYSFRRKQFNLNDAALWGVVWTWFLIATAFSGWLESLLQPLQVVSVFDLLLASGVGISLFFLFLMYRKVRDTEERVRELVRKTALENRK